MIVIERSYDEPNPRGGSKKQKTIRRAFSDDDIDGVNKFINEDYSIPGYEWTNVSYNYIKL